MLPSDFGPEDILKSLREFADYGLTRKFYEVVDGALYEITRLKGQTEIKAIEDEKKLAAWKTNPGSDIPYSDWDFLDGARIFVPGFSRRAYIELSGYHERMGVRGVNSGLAGACEMREEIERWRNNDCLVRAFLVAKRHRFLVTISG
jgi:hypothetical protein